MSDHVDNYSNVELYKTVLVPIEMVVVNEYNPRTIDDEDLTALASSIKEDPDFFKVRPCIINTFESRAGTLIAGSKRFQAAVEKLGWKKVPAMFVKVPPDREKAWNIKDNHHNGKWDDVAKKEILLELHDEGYDMSTIGFTPQLLVETLNFSPDALDKKNDPDYKGTTPRKPKVKIAEGMELTCPNCNTTFTYGVKMETTGDVPQ